MKPLTARERFHATFDYGHPDRVFLMPQWLFNETRQRWLREGLPQDQHLNTYFGYDRLETVPLNAGPWPAIETKVIEQTAEWRVVEDEFGGRVRHWTDREIGMSQWLSYPIRDRDSWQRWKKRLDPDAPVRYPQYWDDYKRSVAGRDYPLGLHAGSYYGWLRNWIGMENLALLYYDDPDWVREMTEFLGDFVLRLVDRALAEIPDFDYALLWEDMAMKTGPLISPALFRQFMSPVLKRVTRRLNECGIRIIMVDCDGNCDDLIPLWLEANVNLLYPIEIAANCDPLRYRQLYGRDLRMIGAIDKRALRDGCSKADIEREVMSKVPALVRQGGFSPFVDHAVPPDVPLANFRYYMDLVHQVCTFG